MTRFMLPLAGLVVLASAAPLSAHHGWTGYFGSDATVTLSGSLSRVSYTNPHVEVELKSQDKTYTIVLAPPARMHTRGLPNGSLKVGQDVTMVGYIHRGNASEMRAERMVMAGNTFEMR
jgi:Family of unknown function (DUF6152)